MVFVFGECVSVGNGMGLIFFFTGQVESDDDSNECIEVDIPDNWINTNNSTKRKLVVQIVKSTAESSTRTLSYYTNALVKMTDY